MSNKKSEQMAGQNFEHLQEKLQDVFLIKNIRFNVWGKYLCTSWIESNVSVKSYCNQDTYQVMLIILLYKHVVVLGNLMKQIHDLNMLGHVLKMQTKVRFIP